MPDSNGLWPEDRSPDRIWRAARRSAGRAPAYEDVVLGNLGRFAEGAAAVQIGEAGAAILWAGETFETWLGHTARNVRLRDLSPRDARVFVDAVSAAVARGEPVEGRRYRLAGGYIELSDFCAFPMTARDGSPVVLLYTTADVTRTNLEDVIFGANQQGVMALSASRDAKDEVVDFEIIAINAAAAALVGQPPSELIWSQLSAILPGVAATEALAELRRVVQTGERRSFESTWRCRSTGRDLHFRADAGLVGDVVALSLVDIGAIKERETSYRLLFEGNPVPMWLFDRETLRFLAVNDAAVRHYGYERERFLAMSLFDIRPEDEWENLVSALDQSEGPHGLEGAWRHRKADGSVIEVVSYARSVIYGDRAAVLVAVTDVTERRRAEARIAYLAHHDALTDLPNRLLFRKHLGKALSHLKGKRLERGAEARAAAQGFAVLCVDLDGFKAVNDSLGHSAGDDLLRQVAQRLLGCVQQDHDCVARFGGDEFAILQASTPSPEVAETLARSIIQAVSAPYLIHEQEVVIGASIGIALAPGDADSPDFLLRNADMALYRAKAEGRRTFCFFETGMDQRLQARRQLEQELRLAFQQGDLELYYQPLIGIETGRVTGCEALLRWRHPERGFISPAEFVPVAEEIGLIGPIGDWVLRRACAEAATWPAEVKVAVNLSPAQFRAPSHLVQSVVLSLANSGLSPARLELEITESVLLADDEGNVATLRQLKALGVRISMDDFGTGYSSLSYLRSFPFDKIKIDQSFVRELGHSSHCVAIVRAVTGLGASLGIITTAEGVETADQLERLRADGCDEVQGFLFSRPLPSDMLREFLSRPQQVDGTPSPRRLESAIKAA